MSAQLAIEGGQPVREQFLPFALPLLGEEEIDEVVDTLRSGWLTTGPKTYRFEEAFREYTGATHAVGLNSCTGALHLSLLALQVGPGDEVITTPLTFAASGNTILMTGARPVFVDVEADTYNLNPRAAEEAISKDTKAILIVHYGGLPADMQAFLKLGERYSLQIIEDAAHAAGAHYGSRKIGSVSSATCFSFYATKTITTGEGGMFTTDSRGLADRVRQLSLHGLSRDAWKRFQGKGSWYYEIAELGYKYNMTDIQAAIGLHQLRKIDVFTARRRAIAKRYDEAFAPLEEVFLPPRDNEHSDHIYHLYTLRIALDRITISRDRFIEALRAENIGSSVHFIPLHLHPYYRKVFSHRLGDYPVTEAVFESVVSVPIYPAMTDQDVNDVITAVTKIIGVVRRG